MLNHTTKSYVRLHCVFVLGLLSLFCLTVTAEETNSISKPLMTNVLEGISLTDKYKIRSGDLLEIKVYQEDDLNCKARVDAEGTVILPLIGRIKIHGMSVEEATHLIEERYRVDFLQHPQLGLVIAEFAPQRIVLAGQVVRPGVYQIPSGEKINLLQAIGMAGGLTKIADASKIRILRRSEKGEESIKVNGKGLESGKLGEIPLVQSEDHISIGESAF